MNYRPISLSNTSLKITDTIIFNKSVWESIDVKDNKILIGSFRPK